MSGLHDQIGKRALELLPEWESAFWASEAANIPEYCFYPDTHLAAQWNEPEKLSYYEKYCLLPDGHCIPHGPVDSEWNSVVFAGNSDPALADDIIHYYLKTILDRLREKEITESARFAGTFAHLLQDSCIPVHAVNNILINRLFPDRDGKYFFYHRLVDGWPFCPERISGKPELLGRTLEETAFVAGENLTGRIEHGMGLLVPFLIAIRDGRKEEADLISQIMNADAVKITMDLWHTLFSIAFHRISAEETKKLAHRNLTDSRMILSCDTKFNRERFIEAGIPFYPTLYPNSDPCRARLSTDPYPYEPAVDSAYDGKGNVIPLALRIGKERVQSERGIAAGGYGIASYRVPGGLYSELDVYAGVHPDSASDQEVTFGIWCHETEKPLLALGKASRKTDALHFVVQLPESCRTVSLLSAGGNRDTSGIWLKPMLKSRIG